MQKLQEPILSRDFSTRDAAGYDVRVFFDAQAVREREGYGVFLTTHGDCIVIDSTAYSVWTRSGRNSDPAGFLTAVDRTFARLGEVHPGVVAQDVARRVGSPRVR